MIKVILLNTLMLFNQQTIKDSVILFHENGKKKIDCYVNNGLLEGECKIFDKEENNIFKGTYRNGQPIDTVTITLDRRKEVWVYTDSLNYTHHLYNNDQLISKGFIENGFYTYEVFYSNDKVDTSKVLNPKKRIALKMSLDRFKKLSNGLIAELEMQKDLNQK